MALHLLTTSFCAQLRVELEPQTCVFLSSYALWLLPVRISLATTTSRLDTQVQDFHSILAAEVPALAISMVSPLEAQELDPLEAWAVQD